MGIQKKETLAFDKALIRKRFLEETQDFNGLQFARKVGCADNRLYSIRSGECNAPRLELMYRVCYELKLPMVYMLGITNEIPAYDFTDRYEIDFNLVRKRLLKSCWFKYGDYPPKEFGILHDAWAKMSLGRRAPSMHMITKYCYFSKTSPDWICGLVDDITSEQKVKRRGNAKK